MDQRSETMCGSDNAYHRTPAAAQAGDSGGFRAFEGLVMRLALKQQTTRFRQRTGVDVPRNGRDCRRRPSQRLRAKDFEQQLVSAHSVTNKPRRLTQQPRRRARSACIPTARALRNKYLWREQQFPPATTSGRYVSTKSSVGCREDRMDNLPEQDIRLRFR